MATETTKREIGGHETLYLGFRPASYAVRFYVRDGLELMRSIRAMPDSSARSYLVAVDTDGFIPDDDGDWIEIVLTVKAFDEHSAERATRKILEKVRLA